jgi:Predicted ATP-dependent endonuclease of the OLD family
LHARLAAESSDAAAAEALVKVVEECCCDGVRGELLLVEEPEMMLTPQAQRYLFRLLHEFAVDNQVIYSTRSPALLDAAHHDEIVRLDLTAAGTVVRRTDPDVLSDAQRVRLAAEFDHERSEMFFARAVILVEGQTERLALPAVFRAMGYDVDALGIAITEVGGKGNLTLAAQLLRQLQIPFLVVFDSDRGGPAAALNAAIRAAAVGAPAIALEPDFEAVAGIHSHDDKVLNAWQRFANADRSAVPQLLVEVVVQAVGLLP